MFHLWKKHEKESDKKHVIHKSGKDLLERANAGLNSEWFRIQKYSIIKELEGADKTKSIIDDKSKENVISSIIDSLESAYELFNADNDTEGLIHTANMFLTAYLKIGNPSLLDRYLEICQRAGISQEEITKRLILSADECNHVDLAVLLYIKASAKDKLIEFGNKALNLYLESKDIDMKTKSRLFDYIIEAYKSANNKDLLISAGDKALKYQIEGRYLIRDKDFILDAQKAYEAAENKPKLAELGDQYVNLYLKEGLEIWLDKSVDVYKKADVDYIAKFNNLADKITERGHAEVADTLRREITKYTAKGV